jgi:hypothetical protein
MAASNLAEYKEWESLVDANWDKWQYRRNLYDYALQKPANSFFTKSLYPSWYQERLLTYQFVTNMQQLGDIKPEELNEFQSLTNDKYLKPGYEIATKGWLRLSALWNPIGLLGWATITLISMRVHKPVSWYIVPGLMFYTFSVGIDNRNAMLNLGNVVDMTKWVAEKRKAELWILEQKKDLAKLPTLPTLESQLKNLIDNFKD